MIFDPLTSRFYFCFSLAKDSSNSLEANFLYNCKELKTSKCISYYNVYPDYFFFKSSGKLQTKIPEVLLTHR